MSDSGVPELGNTPAALSADCEIFLRWQAHATLSAETLSRLEHEAAISLRAIEAGLDIDSPGAEARSMQRIEAKVDLALILLSRLHSPEAPVAKPHPFVGREAAIRCEVQLSSSGIRWREAGPPPPEDGLLVVELRPDPNLPVGVSLPARLNVPGRTLLPNGAGAPDWVGARFVLGDARVIDSLERLVFMLHRRAVQRVRNLTTAPRSHE